MMMMMADYEEMVKLVDGAYKNILEKFNPCARQLISAGKAYLKALHGAMAASKAYIDAIARLARHAHQGTWGGCTDIGTALMQLVDVQKEIQSQQMNILKAFYVDLVVPLESNIEKDSKVVASEQKKFIQQHKTHHEAYVKVASTIKKLRKKRSSRGPNIEKEIKQMQTLEEEKTKLDGFCENSLKQAITQERRRFGFVLERQCSLAKHYLAYHTKGQALLQHNIETWQEIVKTREFLPGSIEKLFHTAPEIRITSEYASSGILSDPESMRLSSHSSHASLMRKTRSIDASCLDLRSLSDDPYPRPLSRAKSDFNLASSSASLVSNEYVIPLRPKSMAETEVPSERPQVKALYSYLSSGEHQLSFHEGDIIALIGERNKGWQYGENLRNHRCGWFPIAYTEPLDTLEDLQSFLSSPERQRHNSSDSSTAIPSSSSESSGGGGTVPLRKRPVSGDSGSTYTPTHIGLPSTPAPRRPLSTFADTYLLRQGTSSSGNAGILHHRQPGLLSPSSGYLPTQSPSSTAAPATTPATVHPPSIGGLFLPGGMRPPKRSLTSPLPFPLPPPRLPASASLHSSNDSGFCNDAPPTTTATTTPAGPGGASVNHKETELDEQEEEQGVDDRPRDNIFASVKLKKVVTNDRSAPMIT